MDITDAVILKTLLCILGAVSSTGPMLVSMMLVAVESITIILTSGIYLFGSGLWVHYSLEVLH